MAKVTAEGGASNAQVCAVCGAQVAPGAPRCPECPSTEFTAAEAAPEAEADVPHGFGDEDPFGSHAGDEDGIPEPDAEGAPAEPQVPDAAPGPAPAVPPRTPPRLGA